MKIWIGIVIVILLQSKLFAQDNYGFADRKALQMPTADTYTTRSIAKYITDNFSTDKEKVRAVYTWITNNIEYSKDSMYQFNRWGIDPELNMNAILRRRKGVCENYAALFCNILVKCGVQSVVVTGYTTINNNSYWNGHGWVAVKADGEWLLCDPTWDAGYKSYNYFLVQPGEFIHTHMPFDPLWQLLEHPISHKDFQHGRLKSKSDTVFFNYKDSITAYLQSDTLQQMQDASRRMQQSGFENEDLKTWYNFNEMKVHIVLQEENMQLFNEAVDNLNKAKRLYNEFVQYRNNDFLPARSREDVSSLFSSADKLLEAANKKLELVGKKSENYQYDTDGLKESLDSLQEKVSLQKIFWKQQLAIAEATKKKM